MNNKIKQFFLHWQAEIFFAVLALLFYGLSYYSFQLYHTLVEGLTIIIAAGIFVFVWNSRRFLNEGVFIIIGIFYLFAGTFEFLHALVFAGVDFFHGAEQDLTNQLHLAARFLQSMALAAAPIFIGRKIKSGYTFLLLAVITLILIPLMFYDGIFPVVYSVGSGLSLFGRILEYCVILLLALAAWQFFLRRKALDANVFHLIFVSVILSIIAELLFIIHRANTGEMNLFGHIFKLTAYYLVYKAIVVVGLAEPYNLLFRNLKESQKTVKVLLDSIPDAAYLCALDGTIMELNSAGAKRFHLSEDKMRGVNFFSLMPQDLAKERRKRIQGLFQTGEPVHFSDERAGMILENSVYPILDESGNIVKASVYSRDVTMQKKAEDELRHSEERYRSLFESIGEGAGIIDKNFIVTYMNGRGCSMLGYSLSEVTGKSVNDFFDEANQKILGGQLKKRTKGGSESYEIAFKRKDGKLINTIISPVPRFDEQGELIESVAIFTDITERKKYEQKLVDLAAERQAAIKELEKFKLAVDNASDHIVFTDINGTILYANKGMERITGYKVEEVIGKNAGKLWGGSMPKEYYKKMWDTFKNKGQLFSAEITNHRKNGETYVAEMHVAPILDSEGQVQFFVGIERDITKAKQIEQMKTEFVSVASHQLRTPLTGIKWFVEILLKNKKNLSTDQLDYIKQIADSNERMVRLVDDLLNISRIDSGHKFDIIAKPADLSPIVREVIQELESVSDPKKVKIVCEHNIDEEHILPVDKDKIKLVFYNLIVNAIQYSHPKDKVEMGCKKEPDQTTFFIRDKGIGIPKNQQGLIFQKFFRADNARAAHQNGTGLGLYIVKAIVEGHKGKIWFESSEGKGTTFYFSLPTK